MQLRKQCWKPLGSQIQSQAYRCAASLPLLNRVALRHDEFVIERKGKPLAALVPIERLEQMRRLARRHALELLERQKQSTVSEEQALKMALEAQRSARKPSRKPRRRTK